MSVKKRGAGLRLLSSWWSVSFSFQKVSHENFTFRFRRRRVRRHDFERAHRVLRNERDPADGDRGTASPARSRPFPPAPQRKRLARNVRQNPRRGSA